MNLNVFFIMYGNCREIHTLLLFNFHKNNLPFYLVCHGDVTLKSKKSKGTKNNLHPFS